MFRLRRKSNAAPTPGNVQGSELVRLRMENATLRAANARLLEANTNLAIEQSQIDRSLAAIKASHDKLRAEQQERIGGLGDIIRGLNKALALKQAEVDKALAEIKKLDGDYIEACGRLQDAEERLAGYQKAVAS